MRVLPPPFLAFYRTPEGFDNLILVSDGEAVTGIYFAGPKGAPNQKTPRTPRTPREIFRPVSAWLDRYFSGRDPGPPPAWRTPRLTPFQLRVQRAMLAIPRGETRTYGGIAAEIARERGVPRVSAQAVGQAVGRNPLCILVPCHRVVGAGGRLVGYGGGLANKAALLRLEGTNT
ncbi:MAG: methylated-DNA--[Kiritimatiellae bacterium]|nr:methylated-DNA--[protein]-cysteine S-methyltransferase [Kiritimatiellia bacterium]